jgi:hypothetical protein
MFFTGVLDPLLCLVDFLHGYKLWQIEKKALLKFYPHTKGNYAFFNFQQSGLRRHNALFEAFGAFLCERFLPLDQRVRGRNIYGPISSQDEQINISAQGLPHFKACYQLLVVSRASKHSPSPKARYVFIDTFLKRKAQGKQILLSKIRLSSRGANYSSPRWSKITFLHTSHGLKEISSKRLQQSWRPWIKKLAKKNERLYGRFYSVHEKIVQK